MSDYVAAYSAATLGYISGGGRGSYTAYKATMAYLKRKKTMAVTRSQDKRKHPDYLFSGTGNMSSVNMLAQKASIKYSGRNNVKSIVGRNKYVKVSQSLRAKVEKVMRDDDGYGVYYTTRQGALALTNPAVGTTRTNIACGGYTAETVLIHPGLNNETGDTRFWQSSMFQSETFVAGDEFQYFTPLKFLDAASILWNNKEILRNYGSQTGNFTNSLTLATGVPITGNASAPDKKGVDLHVINSYVTWELKNNSQRCMNIEIYHCVPKVKFPSALPLETFDGAIAALEEDATTAGTLLSNLPSNANDDLVQNPSLRPKTLEPFSTVYKYEKVSITIAPGETFKHSIQGPKGLDINFSKLYEGEDDMGGKMWNKSSLACMVSLKPDLVYATAGVGSADTDKGIGRFSARGLTSGGNLKDMIGIEVKEVFKMAMPDDTGFVQQAISAGTTQTLNMKKKVTAYGNFCQIIRPGSVLNYVSHDEENTAAAIIMSAIS